MYTSCSLLLPTQPIPFLGFIAAGWGSPAEEELIDLISFDEWLIRNKEASFLLRVSSTAMKGEGINPGDVLIVERGKKPNQGDVILAEVDSEWLMRRYELKNGKPWLIAANAAYKPIEPLESLRVVGVVISVIRKFY